MNYGFNSSLYGKVFAVPGVLVEKHLRLAGAAQLKALLWLLYHSGESCDDEELSRVLGLSRGDVCDAMQYWIDNGLVFACEDRADVLSAKEGIQETNGVSSAKIIPNTAGANDNGGTAGGNEFKKAKTSPLSDRNDGEEGSEGAEKPINAVVSENAKKTLTRAEAIKFAMNDPETAWLLKEAQVRFARPLSSSETVNLVALHINDGLPCAVILMIIEYASASDHCNMRYISSVAAQWLSDEIDTVEKAEAHLKRVEILGGYWRKVLSAFSLEFRRPSNREQIYAERWIGQWHFSQKLLRKAYDVCIDATGKMNMSYIDKVLSAWHDAGVKTPEDADRVSAEKRHSKSKKAANNGMCESTFETSDILNLFWQPDKS